MKPTTPDEYLKRMIEAKDNTTDPQLLSFIEGEIERLTPIEETRLEYNKPTYPKGTKRKEF
jgi:Tfp pilus assembly PilM family ATPase